jgi:arginyl-tRNA synthetase
VGRSARLEGFGLEELGIDTSGRTLPVDEHLQTVIPHILACGDVAGPYQFTHAAAHQAWYAAVNGLFGSLRRFKADHRVIPWCTVLDPEIACVGLNEQEAAAQGLGLDPAKIDIELVQFAILFRGGERVQMSTRAGSFVTLRELREEVGTDAARFFYVMRGNDQHLDFDLDLAKAQSNENPVYYVQYAHARIASVIRNAVELKLLPETNWNPDTFQPGLLTDEREGQLLGLLADYPRVVASAAELREPHRIARFLEEVATGYHQFYAACRVLPQGDDSVTDLNIARLWLCAATRQTIFNGLSLLGVSAPERM